MDECLLMPRAIRYRLYSLPLQGGPLSDVMVSGIPCAANILSSFGIALDALVERTISTSGYLEYLSITTRRYFPDGNGP